ncbi:MAG: zinc-binding dehydrogenase [Rhodobacteraceae bacterium]|nr:zinc-binding dehydrogenase [Paracoccaceae bacterium]
MAHPGGMMRALILKQDGLARDAGTMRGLDAPHDLLELAEIPVPTPGPGQVLIRVRRSTVNPSDLAYVTGTYGQSRVAGTPAGFEGVGTVVATGGGLMARMMKGRNVAFYVSARGSGAWADYAVTDAKSVIPLKKGMQDCDAAAMLVNPISVAAMLDLVQPGAAFVFTAAASQLGKLAASLAGDQGKRMIGIVRRDAPIAALKTLGATHVLNATSPEFAQDLASVLRREKPVIFLDAVGGGPVSSQIFDSMGKGARWVIYGGLGQGSAEILNPGGIIFMTKSVEAFWATNWAAKATLLKQVQISGLVQKRFLSGAWVTDVAAELPLDQALDGLPEALKLTDGKVQIVMAAHG